MNYQEVLDFLYTQLPMYQRVGKVAFKKDLTNTLLLSKELGDPHNNFRSIHVAGTNGKGSTSHVIASVLQSAGYKVGLYTSPHLRSFSERIRVNGEEVNEDFITRFVNQNRAAIENIQPSFFEITVVMAFEYFSQQQVDFAVIETGLGGRLDSTNIISPVLSVITSISMDHQDMLGNTLEAIAREKAGIIKEGVPVVVGQLPSEALYEIKKVATERKAELAQPFANIELLESDLSPAVLKLNYGTIKQVFEQLTLLGVQIDEDQIKHGVRHVVFQTGLKGRWQVLKKKPYVVCDVGHNEEAVAWIMTEIQKFSYKKLHVVWGIVEDKSIENIFSLLNNEAEYYFCAANVPRAMPAEKLMKLASHYHLRGKAYASVEEAYDQALIKANLDDLVFVGGSTFVVAELNDI